MFGSMKIEAQNGAYFMYGLILYRLCQCVRQKGSDGRLTQLHIRAPASAASSSTPFMSINVDLVLVAVSDAGQLKNQFPLPAGSSGVPGSVRQMAESGLIHKRTCA